MLRQAKSDEMTSRSESVRALCASDRFWSELQALYRGAYDVFWFLHCALPLRTKLQKLALECQANPIAFDEKAAGLYARRLRAVGLPITGNDLRKLSDLVPSAKIPKSKVRAVSDGRDLFLASLKGEAINGKRALKILSSLSAGEPGRRRLELYEELAPLRQRGLTVHRICLKHLPGYAQETQAGQRSTRERVDAGIKRALARTRTEQGGRK